MAVSLYLFVLFCKVQLLTAMNKSLPILEATRVSAAKGTD